MRKEEQLPVGTTPTVFYLPFLGHVPAGFPSPAGDYLELVINLNEALVKRPSATFFIRAVGESMVGAHIPSNAILVVDKAERPKNGSIVVAFVNGEFTIKRLVIEFNRRYLAPENPKYKPIYLTEDTQCEIWGVVMHILIDAQTV